MNTRILGRTGLEVTEVGLGGIPIIGVPFERGVRIVHRALDLGINYIDTARGYRDSEAKIGEAMKARRDECYLATKTGQRARDEAWAEIQTSLSELKTDHVDVAQLHDVSTTRQYEQVMGPGGALEALKRARDKGMCRFIGITGHDPSVLLEAVETSEFDTAMFVYNLAINDSGERLLPRCRELNVGAIIMKPLSGGVFFRLTDRRGHPKVPPEAAWSFVLSNPNVSVALAGAKWLKDVHQAVRASRRHKPLTAKQAQRYTALARSIGEKVCRDCRYCDDCPQGIPIPRIMQMVDEARAYPYEWPRYRRLYAAIEPKADVCTECGACEASCPFKLPIMERLKRAHQRFGRHR